MKQNTKKLLIRCINYTLFMNELWFSDEDKENLECLKETLEEEIKK